MGHKNKLGHPLFIFSILLLIINDFYLKYTFHNSFTGKLSDFVGLFAFPFFWSIVFPKRVKTVHFITLILFLFWKSEFSQPLIDYINLSGLKTFRTVDYTDCMALGSILLSYWIIREPFHFNSKPIFKKLLFGLSLFAFVATTQKKDAPTYEDGFKSIDVYNQGSKKLKLIVDFKYSEQLLKEDSPLNNEFNRIDTLDLPAGGSERIITPILQVDSANFPINFKITVLDSLGNKLKVYSKETFLKAATVDYKSEFGDEYSSSWSLIVGDKIPDKLKVYKIYGRWKTESSVKRMHTFEIREQYYYDVDPDSDLAKYEIQDSSIIISYPKMRRQGKIVELDSRNLTIKWEDKGMLKYHKLYE